mmetsp:Transcript_21567/g.43579  ORF Transcript_21567/g.43579 Transcript_21567/m.43579 type:complete len:424 (-) Transcript_21567:154-1425(-)|eukprot:CAMPEP_0183296392 /NCGR_PEP_ID=MMETSP0160_2-20130417/3965_1 /TAXON_ID=2839 ORGANISM="Odontella Sinensis, Strain Grunow 1884" /NCGR_SAMPLE_ID=MMETSP0160_2 /ASSEMBLY_ACC=CAM_ASM_000250 /LENGTH=423 /DNA_ID=CAMNT_0025457999 /DNA_START=99 /DNA_END=1370 /DNA_ORIENTATION=-
MTFAKKTYELVPTRDHGGTGVSPSPHSPHSVALGGRTTRGSLLLCVVLACGALTAFVRGVRGGGFGADCGAASDLPWPAHIPSTSYKFYYPVDPGGVDFRWPRVAWIMSFPNSGTSYTMQLVQRASNRTGGSNYGKECDIDPEDGKNFPIYDDSPSGPFLSQPGKWAAPDRYVPVKTHCGGYTTGSGPDKYTHTVRSFQESCLKGNIVLPDRDEKGKIVKARGKPNSMVEKVDTLYDASLVQRAVHIIRDPFNNIVSRFHLEQHAHSKRKETEWTDKFPNSPEGFKAWCAEQDTINEKEDSKSRFVDAEMLKAFEGVPCHGEFHRYAQWHNLALAVTHRMRLPTHVLHYETYETDFTGTYNDLFFFLELPREGEVPEFLKGKVYEDYFSKKERMKAMQLVKMIAEPETWEQLKRYDVYGGSAL